MGTLGPQGAQKPVKQTQTAAQQTGNGKAPKSKRRGDHRNNRCQKPPVARGSS